MTLLVPTSAVLESRPAREWPAAVQLARSEAWRIVRHPIALAGLALNVGVIVAVGGDGGRSTFSGVTTGSTFYAGVFTYFAANLVTTRERRSGAEELLAPLPAGPARADDRPVPGGARPRTCSMPLWSRWRSQRSRCATCLS